MQHFAGGIPCFALSMRVKLILNKEASRVPIIIFPLELISPLAENCLSNLMFISSFFANRLPDTIWHGRRQDIDCEVYNGTRFLARKKRLPRHVQSDEVCDRFNDWLDTNLED